MGFLGEQEQVGQRLLINYIHDVAITHPTKIAVHQVISYDPKPVEMLLTYDYLDQLIDRIAWWIDASFFQDGKKFPVAYLGPSDLRHLLVSLAAGKVGSKAILLSPRNSVAINEHLLGETQCSRIIVDASMQDEVSNLLTRNFEAIKIPDLIELLNTKTPVEPYPWKKTFDEVSENTFVIFHTSGSTGMPKPVSITNGAMAANDAQRNLSVEMRISQKCQLEFIADAKKVYLAFPLFHVAGLCFACYVLFSGSILVLGCPRRPPSYQILKETLQMTGSDGGMLPPPVVDQMLEDVPFVQEHVSKLRYIFTGGGSINEKTGNLVSQYTRLMIGIGSTEILSMIQYPTDRKHWKYFHFGDELGIKWDPISKVRRKADQVYEMVICRNEKIAQYQSVFKTFPHLTEWRTKDLYRRHPTIQEYWEYQGRADQIIVFSTGEKINPVDIETRIGSLPHVQDALVVGNKRPYPALLVEPNHASTAQKVIEDVSEAIREINKNESRDAQLNAQDVILATLEKPFCRAAKGTVQRKNTEELYSLEIEALYKSADQRTDIDKPIQLDLATKESLEMTLAQMVGSLISKNLGTHDDFFASGLDSRQAQIIAASIQRAMADRSSGPSSSLTPAVYMNPTAHQLAEFLFQETDPKHSNDFEQMLQRFSKLLPEAPNRERTVCQKLDHILLTGSTGFVGSFLLDNLVGRRDIERITCLDRSKREGSRCEDRFPLVRRLQGDLSKPLLGLSQDEYSQLTRSVTKIVHCQWPVNFNWPLSSFEQNIQGLVNLIQLAHESPHSPRLTFLSSIASVKNWDQPVPVPELHLSSPNYAQTGYGQSKVLASLLLHQAGKSSELQSDICRLSQVAGPIYKQGVWPRRDWFPILLHSSKIMECLPDSLGDTDYLDWIPVDLLAEVLGDLVTRRDTLHLDQENSYTVYYHLANPDIKTYQDILPVISSRLGVGTVTFSKWVHILENWALKDGSLQPAPPALNLLSFFQGLVRRQKDFPVRLSTSSTEKYIPSLKVGPVNAEWMERWLDQWGLQGWL